MSAILQSLWPYLHCDILISVHRLITFRVFYLGHLISNPLKIIKIIQCSRLNVPVRHNPLFVCSAAGKVCVQSSSLKCKTHLQMSSFYLTLKTIKPASCCYLILSLLFLFFLNNMPMTTNLTPLFILSMDKHLGNEHWPSVQGQ